MSLVKYLVVAGVLVIAGGAGYRYYKQHGIPSFSYPPQVASSTTMMGSNTSTGMTAFLPPAMDASWQTYRNSTLKFLLQFPTKGMYAPKFGVKVINATDASLKDGCYDEIGGGTIQHLTLNGFDFCRVTHTPNPPALAVDTEYWTTKKDARFAVITFTKKYSTSTTPSFDVNAYRDFVGGLMSTFHYPETSTSTNP